MFLSPASSAAPPRGSRQGRGGTPRPWASCKRTASRGNRYLRSGQRRTRHAGRSVMRVKTWGGPGIAMIAALGCGCGIAGGSVKTGEGATATHAEVAADAHAEAGGNAHAEAGGDTHAEAGGDAHAEAKAADAGVYDLRADLSARADAAKGQLGPRIVTRVVGGVYL